MKNETTAASTMVFSAVLVLLCASSQLTIGIERNERKMEDGRRLFLDVSIALSEERFADAHAMAGTLIRDYAGDYQIRGYLHLYEYTFALVHEEYRTGGVPPVDSPPPKWLTNEVEAIMAKREKGVLDLIKLVVVGDKRICGNNFPANYLEEIVRRFPQSPWAEWAAWVLIAEREYRPKEKYLDKRYEERTRLLARDMYNAGKKFVEEHPDSHMVPGILHMMSAKRLVISQDDASKEEAIRLSRRILEEYPTHECACASARFRLRRLLGENYEEEEGCSEKQDRNISRLYGHTGDLDEYKRHVGQYLSTKKELEAQTQEQALLKHGTDTEKKNSKTSLPEDRSRSPAAYILLAMLVVVGAAGVTLLLKKKTSSSK